MSRGGRSRPRLEELQLDRTPTEEAAAGPAVATTLGATVAVEATAGKPTSRAPPGIPRADALWRRSRAHGDVQVARGPMCGGYNYALRRVCGRKQAKDHPFSQPKSPNLYLDISVRFPGGERIRILRRERTLSLGVNARYIV